MKVLITGGLGHIGSHLIRNIDPKVITDLVVVDNLLTQRYSSIFGLKPEHKVKFIEEDVNSHNLAKIIEDADVVIHLAAITNAEKSSENLEEIEETNIKGLEAIANLCSRFGTKLIFPSTTSVYGKQNGMVDENCSGEELQPQSAYAESKIRGEKLLEKISLPSNLQFAILRVGTIFGYSQGMRFHTAVNKFIWEANLGLPISVWTTAIDQLRPYCGLNDFNAAIHHLLKEDLFKSDIFNIVTLNTTVREVIKVIENQVGKVTINYVDSQIMNQLSYEVSNEKSLSYGFRYNDSLEEEIKKTLSHLNGIRNAR
jgi:UDP-glucose 4-epimerase